MLAVIITIKRGVSRPPGALRIPGWWFIIKLMGELDFPGFDNREKITINVSVIGKESETLEGEVIEQ